MEDITLIIDIACRFNRVVEAHALEPAYSADELVDLLYRAHTVHPLDLHTLLIADEVDLVVKVSDAIRPTTIHQWKADEWPRRV